MGMIPDPRQIGGWWCGWAPDPRQIGDEDGGGPDPRQIGNGTRAPIPVPRQIGDGDGDGDRGFRALPGSLTRRGFLPRGGMLFWRSGLG